MRALVSVSDKTGLVQFCRSLSEWGVEIISTGGTSRVLSENGVSNIPIESVTGFPEMMDGRVKTLHPKIHGGLLARRDDPHHLAAAEAHGIGLIDIVVVNLYPFEQTTQKPGVSLEEVIENIDIGGPSMIRSAAKNYRSVAVVVNPARYDAVISELKANAGQLSDLLREDLALEAFEHTGRYDTVIAMYLKNRLRPTEGEFPPTLAPVLEKKMDLRYGENPHQKAAFYATKGQVGSSEFRQLHGKELSYNNLIDMESAWLLATDLNGPGAAIIKHTNPCGCAVAPTIVEAYKKAYESDPLSAFGSIVAVNRPVDEATAIEIAKTFVELVIAPRFEPGAVDVLVKKSAIRLIEMPNFDTPNFDRVYRQCCGGFLVQDRDAIVLDHAPEVVTQTAPKDAHQADLELAYALVKNVKSNAIVVVKDGVMIGVGAGQTSRVDSVEIALKKSGLAGKGAVLASDAFFPFKDSVELSAKAGIAAIIQPGGSKRDQDSIDACNAYGIAMVFTGIRHFKH